MAVAGVCAFVCNGVCCHVIVGAVSLEGNGVPVAT